MKKEELDYAIRCANCVPNGSKEACMKVREFLQNVKESEHGITTSHYCAVNNQEFLDAVRVLMAFAWQNKENDCVPEMWYCDSDCSNIDSCVFCPGEFQVAPRDEKGKSLGKKICPYFADSIYK